MAESEAEVQTDPVTGNQILGDRCRKLVGLSEIIGAATLWPASTHAECVVEGQPLLVEPETEIGDLNRCNRAGAREGLRQVAREYHKELVADRGMDMEAQLLEIIQELQSVNDVAGISIKEIASRFIEQHGEDFERKVTPHWVGQIVRRKLQLKTERRRDGYVIAATEAAKLARLFERYGISSDSVNLVNSVNSEGDMEASSSAQEPLII
jgi:hypothetical protein